MIDHPAIKKSWVSHDGSVELYLGEGNFLLDREMGILYIRSAGN